MGKTFDELLNQIDVAAKGEPVKPTFDDLFSQVSVKQETPIEGSYEIPEFNRTSGSKIEYLKDMAQGGIRELRDMGSLMQSGVQGALLYTLMTPEDKFKVVSEISKNFVENPGMLLDLAKTMVKDTMASFGQTPRDLTTNPDVFLPRIAEKLKDKPIETISDLSIVFGVGRMAVTKGIKGIQKAAGQKALKDIIDKKALRLKVINQDLKTGYKTVKDDLLDNAEVISKIPRKQLNDIKFIQDKGQLFAKDIRAIELLESDLAKKAIEKVGNVPIDNATLYRNIMDDLRSKGLVDAKGRPEPGKINSIVASELSFLKKKKNVLNAPQLKLRLDYVNEVISYVNPKLKDTGSKAVRTSYREYLGALSPEFDAIQLRRHRYLNAFGGKLRPLKKPGGGERFAKSFVKTDEELALLSKALDETPFPVGAVAKARFDQIRAWHSWNNYLRQNERYMPSFLWANRGLPIPVAKITDPLKQGVTKLKLKTPAIKKPTLVQTKAALELKDLFKKEENK